MDIRYKVLFLVSWYPSRINPINGSAIKKHAEAVAKYCDVGVLHVTRDPNLKDKNCQIECSEENGILIIRVYHKVLKVPFVPKLIKVIRCIRWSYPGLKMIEERFGRPDIVHVNVALPAGAIALILKYLKSIPYIITEHYSAYTEESGRFSNYPIYIKLLSKLIFKNAEAVTAVSDFLINALKKNGLIKDNYFTTPNIIDIPQNLDWNKDDTRIRALTVSRLQDKTKNLSGLIKAFSKVASKYENIELHIIGDGKDREKLETLAVNLGLLDKNIFFHGYVPNDELHKYFAQTNFFILNSNFETFSLATAEAIAHGVPVVVTKCGGVEEFVTKEVGIFIERKNEESLVKGIEYMIENWHKYDPVKLHNYAKVRFSYEKVGKMFYEIYRDISVHTGMGLHP